MRSLGNTSTIVAQLRVVTQIFKLLVRDQLKIMISKKGFFPDKKKTNLTMSGED